ncbi:MAG: phage antirepressor KilAC domain-containing protein [Propionibacteriaceae bacterium]|nr:phage antirepressor KilAC domain-containing protein [Propionibacteriaceae bacterium]
MNEMIPFTYEDTSVRVLDVEGEPWFVAADIAASLRYASAKDFVRGLDDEDKGRHIVPTPSGDQEMTVISEGGLYTALVRSRTERAKPFRRWVTHEVLPQIRRTGGYSTQPAPQLTGKELLAAAVLEAAETIKQQEAQIAAQQEQLDRALPKANTWDAICSGRGDHTITDAAKLLSSAGVVTGPRKLHAQLQDLGWIHKDQRGRWAAYQDRLNAGLLAEKARHYLDDDGVMVTATPQVRVTPKGLQRLRELLAPIDVPQLAVLEGGLA